MLSKNHLLVALITMWTMVTHGQSTSCIPPLLKGLDHITTSSFVIQWQDFNGGDVSWDIEYLPSGTPQTSLPTIENISEKSVLIGDLAAGTAYDIYMRTQCTEDEYSDWNGPFTFRTAIDNNASCVLDLPVKDNNCPGSEDFYIAVENYDGMKLGKDIFIQSIEFIIAHDWPADLQLSLKSPEGNKVPLISNKGIGKDHFGNPEDTLCMEVVEFSDFSCDVIDEATAGSTITGSFLPEKPISELYKGEDVNGLWSLNVCDRASDDIGNIKYLRINFSPIICNAPTEIAAININATKVDIRWTPESDCNVAIINVVKEGETPGSGIEIFTACQGGIFKVNDLQPETSYDIYIKSDCGASESSFSCPVKFTTACNNVSYALSFDDQDNCENTCLADCPLNDQVWSNLKDDSADWIINSGETPTTQTGPDGDIIGIGNYAYVENAIELCGGEQLAIMQSQCIYIPDDNNAACDLSFYYHMYGDDINELAVRITIDEGSNWEDLLIISGDQGNNWKRHFIDLSPYAGQYAKLRFIAMTGAGDRSDLAIDQIEFYGTERVAVLPLFYYDEDGDDYGTSDSTISFCLNEPPPGFSYNGNDCEDKIASINPGQLESPCNAIDDNCDGIIDEVEDNPIIIDIIKTSEETCPGALDGAISIQLNGGIPPYQITWNNGMKDKDINNLSAGVYFVEVEDAAGCRSRSEFIEIDLTTSPTIFINNVRNTQCGQTIGNIDIEMTGGTPPYMFNWSDGSTQEDLINVGEGTYMLTVNDVNGCQVISDPVKIIASPRFTAGIQLQRNLRCYGDSNGIISIGVINAVPPVNFHWNNGDSSATIEDLKAGIYSVTISDQRGCDEVISTEITVPLPLTSTISGIENITCFDETNGKIQVNTIGGKAPFNFNWNSPDGQNINNPNAEDLINVTAGNYQLMVRDANGCTAQTDVITLTNPEPIQIEVIQVTPVECRLSENGEIQVNASGGNGEYEYFWSNGEKGDNLSGLTGGKYSIRVIDQLGCKAANNNLEINILDNPIELEAEILRYNNCSYDSVGIIAALLLEDTQLPIDYNWSNGQQNLSSSISDTIRKLSSGIYNLTVTDREGCTGEVADLIIPTIEEITIDDISIFSTDCNSDTTGQISISVSGGKSPYTYLWNTGDTTPEVIQLPNGVYTITISDQNNCQVISDSILIDSQNPINIFAVIQEVSNGQTNGSIELTIDGGDPPYTITWEHDGSNTSILDNLPPGNYCVQISDSKDCYLYQCFDVPNSTGTSIPKNMKFTMHPNPARERLSITSPIVISYYQILGMDGKLISQGFPSRKEIVVLTNSMPSGLYIIVIDTEEYRSVGKITVIK